MNVHNDVLYDDNAVVILVLHEVILLFKNVHNDVLYEDNAIVTLVLHPVMLLFINVVELVCKV